MAAIRAEPRSTEAVSLACSHANFSASTAAPMVPSTPVSAPMVTSPVTRAEIETAPASTAAPSSTSTEAKAVPSQ